VKLIVVAPPDPPHWTSFQEIARELGPSFFGFKDDWPLAHRFRARYRLAHVCKGLKTEGYSSSTAHGYDALTRTFLSWSLFELFLKLTSTKGDTAVAALLDAHGAPALLDSIKAVPAYDRFFATVLENVDRPKHRNALTLFLAGQPCDPGIVLASVRHVFAHGFLTPHARGIEPEHAAAICNSMTGFIVALVRDRWQVMVDDGLAEVYAP
jgi:hypothetical protein